MTGSGGAPQLDERRWTIYRDRIGDRIGHWQVENTPGVADAFGREKVEVVPLAASPGAGEAKDRIERMRELTEEVGRLNKRIHGRAGELDLTDEEIRVLLDSIRQHAQTAGPGDIETLVSARSKLRARLDRKDDDGDS